MSEKLDTLDIIDDTIKAVEEISTNFSKIIEVLHAARDDLLNLEKEKLQLQKEKKNLEEEKISLEREKE